MALICGIDEAGRGPVLGPLVMCGVVVKEEDQDKLKAMGVKDSKLLLPHQRTALFDKIKKAALKYKIIVIEPKDIDEAVQSDLTNLNWLEANHIADIIIDLAPDKAVIDCPSPNIKAYHSYLKKRLDFEVELNCCHHADRDYPVVGAASILAKVTRDNLIEEIKKKIGKEIGSGYPSDPLTQKFLAEYWDTHHEIFRHSWESYKRVAGMKDQKKLGEY